MKTETYNQKEIDDKLDLKLNASLISNYYLKTETYNQKEVDDKLATKQNLINASTDLVVSSLTAQTHVSTPTLRATNIEFLDTSLTIKTGSTYFTSMSPSTGIKHYTYTDFNNNHIINIRDITGVNNILGSGIFAATRGSFVYMSASGTTYLRPTAPNNQGVYIGQASSTSSGIEMTATGETTIDFSSPGTNYKGRIQYDNSTESFNLFTNASATATMSLTSTTVTVPGSLTVNKLITRNIEPPPGFTDINLNANSVYFGNPIWLSATSEMVKFWTPAYFDNAIKLKQGLVIGSDLSSNNNTVSISFDGTITTQGTISCVGSVTAGKVISNTIEAVAVGDTVSIKGNWVNFGNGVTHTILGSTVSEFFSGPIFHEGIQVRKGIESGYYSASQPDNFASTFIVGQAGDVYAKGNIRCEGILSAPNIYTKAQTEDLIATKQPLITSATNLTLNTLTATKVVSNTLETVGIMDQLAVKSNWVIFGNGLTHTILASTGSEFFSNPIFHEGIQVRKGIESGYYSTSQPNNFASTFIVGQAGDVYAKGNIRCDGVLTAPNIYNKTQVEDLLNGKQNALIFRDPTQLDPPVQGFPLLSGGNIIPGIAVGPQMTLTYYGNDYIEIGLAIDLNQKANTATTYTKSEVDGMLSTKASTSYVDASVASLLDQDLITVNSLVVNNSISIANSAFISSGTTLTLKGQSVKLTNALNQSIISFNSTNISLGMAVNMNNNSISYLTDLTASGTISAASVAATGNISSNTMTTNTLTTSGAVLNIKNDLVLFKANDNTIYLEANANGVLCSKDFYTEGVIKNKGGFSVGAQTGVGVWTSHCDISSTGNISTNGTITSAGLIQGFSLTVTGSSPSSVLTPAIAGVHINNFGGYAHIDLAGSSSGGGYLDFGNAGADYKGRMVYRNASNQFEWYINSSGTIRMSLAAGGLYVGGTLVSSSDKRLKFNEKPLVNALGLINRLTAYEYDQTIDIVDNFTKDTPQSHQAGFIAQDVQKIDELKFAVQGGIGEDGKESVRALNYNVIFTYAVKAIQELSDIVKQQQIQIDLQQQQINKLLGL